MGTMVKAVTYWGDNWTFAISCDSPEWGFVRNAIQSDRANKGADSTIMRCIAESPSSDLAAYFREGMR